MRVIGSTVLRRLCGIAVFSIGLLLAGPAVAHAEPNVPVPRPLLVIR